MPPVPSLSFLSVLLSLVSNFQGDLLRIVFGDDLSRKVVVDEQVQDSDDVELSLGLSLNGRFGVDPKAKAETEDEWRKRKELQSLRRMEVKRKRSEKQQKSYSKLHRGRSWENFEEDRRVEAINGGACPPLPSPAAFRTDPP